MHDEMCHNVTRAFAAYLAQSSCTEYDCNRRSRPACILPSLISSFIGCTSCRGSRQLIVIANEAAALSEPKKGGISGVKPAAQKFPTPQSTSHFFLGEKPICLIGKVTSTLRSKVSAGKSITRLQSGFLVLIQFSSTRMRSS